MALLVLVALEAAEAAVVVSTLDWASWGCVAGDDMTVWSCTGQ